MLCHVLLIELVVDRYIAKAIFGIFQISSSADVFEAVCKTFILTPLRTFAPLHSLLSPFNSSVYYR